MIDADDLANFQDVAEVVVDIIPESSNGDTNPITNTWNWRDWIPHFFVTVTVLAIVAAIIAVIIAVLKS